MLIDQTFKLHFMEMSGNHHHHHQHQLLQQHVEVDHHHMNNKVDTSMPARLDLVIKTSEYLAKRDKVMRVLMVPMTKTTFFLLRSRE